MREIRIEVSDEVFSRIEAVADGDVAAFLREAVTSAIEASNMDTSIQAKFTPEVVAHLESISEDVAGGGQTFSADEVREYIAQYSDEKRQA